MKQMFEQIALLLVAFIVAMAFGWLAADVFHQVADLISKAFASA